MFQHIKIPPKATLIIIFFVFIFFGLLISARSLNYPFAWDDLHLIRPYSTEQILGAFHGTYEPDTFETPGIRPLTMLFNYSRYLLFGENVIDYRILAIILESLFFTLLTCIMHRFGMTWPYSILAGLISFSARFNLQNAIWATDSNHALGGIFLCASCLLLLRYLDTRRLSYLIFSWLGMVSSLLLREDNLVILPLVFVAGACYWWGFRRINLKPLIIFGMICFLSAGAYYAYDIYIFPDIKSNSLNILGYLLTVFMTIVGFSGLQIFNLWSKVIIYGWILVFFAISVSMLLVKDKKRLAFPLAMILCLLVSCAFGLKTFRSNILLFPLTFLAYYLASMLSFLQDHKPGKWVGYGVLVFILIGNVYIFSYAQQAYHPASTYMINWNGEYVYGDYAGASVPEERLAAEKQYLSSFGIKNEKDYLTFTKAIEHGIFLQAPGAPGEIFMPYLAPFGNYERTIFAQFVSLFSNKKSSIQ